MRIQLIAKTTFNPDIVVPLFKARNIVANGKDNDILAGLCTIKDSGFPIELFSYSFIAKVTSQELIALRELTSLSIMSIDDYVIMTGSLQVWKNVSTQRTTALISLMAEVDAYFSNLHPNHWTNQNGPLRISK